MLPGQHGWNDAVSCRWALVGFFFPLRLMVFFFFFSRLMVFIFFLVKMNF